MATRPRSTGPLAEVANRVKATIENLAQKLKSTREENTKLKSELDEKGKDSESVRSILESAIDAGEKALLVLVAVGTVLAVLYYGPAPSGAVTASDFRASSAHSQAA